MLFRSGNVITAKYSGTVKVSENLVLYNALYVPDFHFNLISVSQLALYNNVLAQFIDNKCVLQDKTTNQVIGYSELHQGLYQLHKDVNAVSLSVSSVSDVLPVHESVSEYSVPASEYSVPVFESVLWHRRLGHCPLSKLRCISQLNLSHCNSDFPCDVCQFSRDRKNTRLNSSHAQ